MFDIGWLELIVIGIVALIVVGPKDLPGLFHSVGKFMGKARGMAREFQRSMEDAARESGINDAAKTIRTATNPLNEATKAAKNYSKKVMDDITPDGLTEADLTGDAPKPSPKPGVTPPPAASAPQAQPMPDPKPAAPAPVEKPASATPDNA